MKKILFILIITILSYGTITSGYDQNGNFRNYIYNNQGIAVPTPDAYVLKNKVFLNELGDIDFNNPQDIFISEDGKSYIVDTNNNRVVILNDDFSKEQIIENLYDNEGKEYKLNRPEGIFVDESRNIYIADTQNNRIIKTDIKGMIIQVINKPDRMIGLRDDEPFIPVKIAADRIGRIFVVARNINLGIIQLDEDGRFLGYTGAPRVHYSITELIWRRFSTQEQRRRMLRFVPTEYSNISIDDLGFIYGTISTINPQEITAVINTRDRSGNTTPIKRLNPRGNDILKRNGYYPPIGDLQFSESPSRIIDVAVKPDGRYSLLDSARGRIFTYDDNGNILFVFGNRGSKNTDMQRPVAISYFGNDIIVLDSLLCEIFIYTPTNYGSEIINAVSAEFEGDFNLAYDYWSNVSMMNNNFEFAFTGLGNALIRERDFELAMEAFRFARDKENYSIAREMWRREKMQSYFPFIITVLLTLLFVYFLKIFIYKPFKKFIKED